MQTLGSGYYRSASSVANFYRCKSIPSKAKSEHCKDSEFITIKKFLRILLFITIIPPTCPIVVFVLLCNHNPHVIQITTPFLSGQGQGDKRELRIAQLFSQPCSALALRSYKVENHENSSTHPMDSDGICRGDDDRSSRCLCSAAANEYAKTGCHF